MARTATKTKTALTRKLAAVKGKARGTKKMAPKKAVRKAKKFPALALKPIRAKLNRTELVARLVDETEVPRKQVMAIINSLGDAMKASLMPKACGEFAIPGILMVKARKVPAKKMPAIKKGTLVRRPGSPDPVEHPGRAAFVKPATVKVKVRGLAKLKRAALGTE
jgi:nucleoid DNA-binding protein